MFGVFIWIFIVMVIVLPFTLRAAGKNKQRIRQPLTGQGRQSALQQSTKRVVTDADRAKLEEYRRRKMQGAKEAFGAPEPNQDLSANRRRNAAQPNIVERAKANSQRYAGEDEMAGGTRSEMEEESCLGTIEDLMVKGYDGDLSFERDFIGEAQDFLASISFPES